MMAKLGECIGLFTISFICFSPCTYVEKSEFVFDDGVAIAQNTDVTNTSRTILESIQQIVVHDFWGQNISDHRSHKSYRPIITFMYNLEYRSFPRDDIAGYMKRINLLIHTVICCMLLDLLRRIFHGYDQRIIWIAVILFTLHPIHTENVCSCVGRADLMCTFFFISAINLYLDIIYEHERNSKKELHYGKLLHLYCATVACLFSKEIGIMILPFCAAYDVTMDFHLPKIRKSEKKERFSYLFQSNKNVIVRCAILSGMMITLVIFRSFLLGYDIPKFLPEENPIAAHPSLFTRTFTYFYLHALHFWLMVCPDWLCFDWSHNCIKFVETLSDQRVFFSISLYSFLIYAFVISQRAIRVGILFLVLPFIPAANVFVSVGFVIADRILYIPSIGYCILVAFGVYFVYLQYPKTCQIATIFCLIVLMLRSALRAQNWTNNENLFGSGVEVCPNNAKIYYNLGQLAAEKSLHNQSIKFNLISNQLKPKSPSTLNNLANAYRNVGEWDTAIKYHIESLEIFPDYALGWMNLGVTYAKKGLFKDALNAYKKSDELQPNSIKTMYNLGNAYLFSGDYLMAKKMYQRVIEMNPFAKSAQINLIRLLHQLGFREELIMVCNNAEKHLKKDVDIMMLIAEVLSTDKNNFERIESIYLRIIELQPQNFKAHLKLAQLYKDQVDIKKAMHHYRKAIALDKETELTNEDYVEFLLDLKRENDQDFRTFTIDDIKQTRDNQSS